MLGTRLSNTLALGTLVAALATPTALRAGGGPENVFLVVNSASWASQSVANHFIDLRKLAPVNVLYVNWQGGFESVKGDTFRREILGPVLRTIQNRGLVSQIDYIIYSSDFPYAVDLTADFEGKPFIDQARPSCSINSATYLWHLVFSKSIGVMQFQVNRYMRGTHGRTVDQPTHGFHSWYGWGKQGELTEAGGQPYMLSTMLGVTSGRGNSVNEVINYLRRAAAADGTHPKGTIYYCKTDDVRSKARWEHGEFDSSMAELKRLGVGARIISSALPAGRDDVVGLMSGVASFSWPRTGSKILPGAICENFTSFGGILSEGGGQTPLSEFLRYGAAGASGTVVEPYAMDVKFPSPRVQIHYARGCTLAEAFYQSVFAPAQLLIVGDPLCRPWADIPQVEVAGVSPDGNVSGSLELNVKATLPGGANIDRFELFVDGRRMASSRSGQLAWDSTSESDGYHELRIVAIDDSPIESQGRAIFGVTVNNHKHTIQVAASPANRVRWGQPLKVRIAAPGMSRLLLVHNARVLGAVAGPQGEIRVDPRLLGIGPVRLQAVGTAGRAVADRVWSAPLEIVIEPAEPLPALTDPPTGGGRGLVLQLPSKRVMRVDETRDAAWPTLKGLRPNEPFVLQGFFDVPTQDVYQFQVWHSGDLKLSVDGRTIYDGKNGDKTQKFAPVALAQGVHRLTATGRTGSDVRLRILFGGPGTISLSRDRFFHAR